MRVISWNLNSRTNEETLEGQLSFLKAGDFDVITLQEVTLNSEVFFKESFKDMFVLSSLIFNCKVEDLFKLPKT